jgi:hypothetical protein
MENINKKNEKQIMIEMILKQEDKETNTNIKRIPSLRSKRIA